MDPMLDNTSNTFDRRDDDCDLESKSSNLVSSRVFPDTVGAAGAEAGGAVGTSLVIGGGGTRKKNTGAGAGTGGGDTGGGTQNVSTSAEGSTVVRKGVSAWIASCAVNGASVSTTLLSLCSAAGVSEGKVGAGRSARWSVM